MTKEGREVWLDKGEAYFEVAHAGGRPFVVHAGRRTVTVLGTKFSVRRDAAKVTVAVLEGRVRVDDVAQREEQHASLIPAMLASFLESDRAFVRARQSAARSAS